METKSTRRKWTRDETLALLDAYKMRKEESPHSIRKKTAMGHVMKDLVSRNVLTQPTTEEALAVKIKNLLRAFKQARDEERNTGAERTLLPFEEQMEEIFGDRPIMRNTHSLALSGQQICVLQSTSISAPNIAEPGDEVARPKKARMSKEKYFQDKLNTLKQYTEKNMK